MNIAEADNEWFDERAGILQFDAGLTRDAAEKEALMQWIEWRGHVPEDGV